MLAFCETRFSDIHHFCSTVFLLLLFFWQLTEVPFVITASSVHSKYHKSNGLLSILLNESHRSSVDLQFKATRLKLGIQKTFLVN